MRMARFAVILVLSGLLKFSFAGSIEVFVGEEKYQVIDGKEDFFSPTYIQIESGKNMRESEFGDALLEAVFGKLGESPEILNERIPLLGSYAVVVVEIKNLESLYVMHFCNELDYVILSRGVRKGELGGIAVGDTIKGFKSETLHNKLAAVTGLKRPCIKPKRQTDGRRTEVVTPSPP
jgi:hypothetical protein